MLRFGVLVALLGLRIGSASTGADLARKIQQSSLDPEECYRVVDLNFSKEDVKVFLTSGYLIFSKPIAGVRHAAVYVTTVEAGDAEVLLLPPLRSERYSLAAFTQSPNLNEHFKSAVFIFTDETASNLISQIRENPALKKSQEMGDLIAGQWNSVLQNLSNSFETRLVHDILAANPASGIFYMAVSGNELGNFDIVVDPSARDQVFVGKLAYRNNRAYFDTWTAFASRSTRSGVAPFRPDFSLDSFRIESSIEPDLLMKVVTKMTLTPKAKIGVAIPFFISENMRVTQASIDGQPVEVFGRDSLRSNLIASGDNHQFLLISASPLDPAKPHEIEIHHEGEVIQKAGAGIYFVSSRGTWYPRLGAEFAAYDLTFRFPKNLTLVATGNQVEDRVEGNVRINRYKTEAPTRHAGFNLGEFQSVSFTQNGYKIDVYANRRLESALQPKNQPAPLILPPVNPIARSRTTSPAVAQPLAMPVDPGARLQQLAKDVGGALDFMTAQYGPPAIHNLTISPIPGTFGQGFPGLVYLSTLAYLDPEQRPESMRERSQQTFFSELLEVHEVAHQWWGNTVISAGYQDEWLMESLANYSSLLLLEKRKGAKAVETVLDDYRSHLLTKTEGGRTLESSGPITWGFRLQNSLAPGGWRIITYEKGTWIIHMLRRRLGDEQFLSMLHEICTQYRFQTLSTEQFREMAAKYTAPKSPDASLKTFFENWVYGTGIPAVKLSYAWRGTKLTGTLTQREVADDFTAFVPVEVVQAKKKTVYWLPTGSEPASFSIPLKLAPTKVSLLSSDCLMMPGK